MSVYEGTENYIFVSYAHKDAGVVIPVVEALQQNGFRVWYDSGIEAGTEWPEYIETHLKNSDRVLIFMSEAAVESRNCRNEINFAADAQKEMLVIYLEDVELRYGMKLQLGSTQSMFKDRHLSDESFIRELCEAKLLQSCKGDAGSAEPLTQAAPQTPKQTQKKIMISNICTMGTNENKYWPDGKYSDVIDRDEFQYVCVHIDFLQKPGAVEVDQHFKIYDEDGNVVRETEGPYTFSEGSDRFSYQWRIRRANGSFVKAGKYRVEASFGSGNKYTYYFTVTAGGQNRTQEIPVQNAQTPTIQNTQHPVLISNVCTIGTNDDNDLWPVGRYSDTINRDKTRILRFRVQLLKPIGYNGSATVDKKIYDANGNLVLDETTPLDVQQSYDRFSLSWILKNSDGSFVASGKYHAEISINGGKVFQYAFTVTSDSDINLGSTTGSVPMGENEKAIADLEKKIARPQGMSRTLLSALGGFIAMICIIMESGGAIVAGALIYILCNVPLYRYTKKYIWNWGIGAVILVYPLGMYYGIYTIVMGIGAMFRMAEWKKELARLKQNS